MSTRLHRCGRCGRLSSPDARYCWSCGEAVDPALIAELQWLYGAMRDLDTRIARGAATQTISELRDEYREHYLAIRRAPAERPRISTSPLTATVTATAAAAASPDVAAGTLPSVAAPTPPEMPETPVAPAIPVEPRPAGPVFSWQAFLSEQAIAIMMYMGGFLGLVAMLSFEIGGWQSLDLSIKLGAIILVYLAFGTLGLVMRRLPRLQTVGGAYLGVFALMTPLLALGIYRFGLQAAGFSGAAMLSLSSAYAAIVYLALAWRTRFITYAYLGWTAMILAALAVVFWVDAPREALIVALAVAALLLLLPGLFHRFPLAAVLETPALQLAVITALAAAGGTLFLWLALSIRAISDTPFAARATPPPQYSTAVYALSACILVPVAGIWSYLARRLSNVLNVSEHPERLNVVDWLVVASTTQAVIALAAWTGADRRAMCIVLAVLALAEVAALFALWRHARERDELRYLVESLALLLAIGGCFGVASDPAPNWPYLLALTAGVVVTGGLAFFESAPLWLLPAGIFLSLDYHALIVALFPPAAMRAVVDPAIPFTAVAAAVLVLVLVLPWQVAPSVPRVRRFALPAYVIALGNAIYATTNLIGHDAFYATLILGLFVLLALLAGWRSRAVLAGGLVASFFGFFLPLPLSVAGGESRFVAGAALMALGVALVALGIRGLLGRASALPAYLVALWTALVVSMRLLVNPTIPAGWDFFGTSLSVWLLLAFALLATAAILWDDLPWALFIPALFGMIAAVTASGLRGVALTVGLVAAGMFLRWWRGRWWWSIAWYIAALLASLAQLIVFLAQTSHAPNRPMYVALLFALLAYLAAVTERQPWLTAVVPFYVLVAAASAPGSNRLPLMLVIIYGVFIVGLVLRLNWGRRWALACYLAAIVPSLLAPLYSLGPHSGVAEALLLVFALTAYGLALIEHAPSVGAVAVVYVWLAAVVQPDPHVLLPLSLALAAFGIAIGRIDGWRWAWPAYASSLVAGGMTTILAAHEPGFEAWALLALALTAYLVAVIESLVESLALALLIGVLALVAARIAFGWLLWQSALSFVALSWLYIAGQWLWAALPWLRERPSHAWWDPDTTSDPRWQDIRQLGRMIHHIAGLLVGSCVVVVALLLGDTLTPQAAMTQVEVVALLSLAAIGALSAWTIPLHPLWYVSGALLAIAVSWQVRWFGADNIQAFVLAPGSYLLIIGALLPADRRFRSPALAGQMASLSGALLLLLPTLAQSFTTAFSENWIYATVLALEALAIAAVGVGTHTRVLILLGTGFFGLAAIRGALLAFSSGVPVALIIAALALLLMGGATWLSLRVRHDAEASQL